MLILDKPAGITSHDVVQSVRRKFGTRRVGHAGTLDPMATGLLVLAVGPATRFLQYLPLEPKEYVCTFRFGIETETYDADGATVQQRELPGDLTGRINAELPSFMGLISQFPPLYSAVKREGRPLYAYARAGEEVEVESRNVFVESFDMLGQEGADFEFRIVCSGGTYVRSLAHDLGQAVGCGAHVCRLTRTQIGRFPLSGAINLADCSPDDLVPLHEALAPMPLLTMNDGQWQRVQHGQFVQTDDRFESEYCALARPDGLVVSVARCQGNLLHPECVIPSEALPPYVHS